MSQTGPPVPATGGETSAGPRTLPRRRSRLRTAALAGGVMVVLIGGMVALARGQSSGAGGVAATATAAPVYTAHGYLRPRAEARVGTQNGGTVILLPGEVGQTVVAGQEVAEVRGPNGIESIQAPFRGTLADIAAHQGDTVVPGTVIATVDDLSRLHVETTDVDEFLLPHLQPGQSVALAVEAIEGLQLAGQVRSVGVEPRVSATNDRTYPVVIDLVSQTGSLWPGMTVDITFGP